MAARSRTTLDWFDQDFVVVAGPKADGWVEAARALSGRNVHDAETTVAQWFSAARKAAPSLREVAPDMPEEIVRTIDAALAFERDSRPDAAAFHASLVSARAFLRGDVGAPAETSFVAMSTELRDLQKR